MCLESRTFFFLIICDPKIEATELGDMGLVMLALSLWKELE